MAGMSPKCNRSRYSTQDIIDAACAEMMVEWGEVISDLRGPRICRGREVVAASLRKYAVRNISWPEIARLMGKKNHSTIHAAAGRANPDDVEKVGEILEDMANQEANLRESLVRRLGEAALAMIEKPNDPRGDRGFFEAIATAQIMVTRQKRKRVDRGIRVQMVKIGGRDRRESSRVSRKGSESASIDLRGDDRPPAGGGPVSGDENQPARRGRSRPGVRASA